MKMEKSRECDLIEFFRHENQPFLAALNDGVKLIGFQKSHHAAILKSHVTVSDTEPALGSSIWLDGTTVLLPSY